MSPFAVFLVKPFSGEWTKERGFEISVIALSIRSCYFGKRANFGTLSAVIGGQPAPRLWSHVCCGVLGILTAS